MSRIGCMAPGLPEWPWEDLAGSWAAGLPRGAAGGWCPSRSSKPVSRRSPAVGRFDSCAAPLHRKTATLQALRKEVGGLRSCQALPLETVNAGAWGTELPRSFPALDQFDGLELTHALAQDKR